MADGPYDSRSKDDPDEELLYVCLERVSTEGPGALDAMCAEHPAHATALREGFERLAAMGLVESPTAEATVEFPEYLDEYRLIRRIGGGGMGVVYLAEQESLSRRVALKVIRPDRVYYPQEVARFRREVDAIAQLRHPGIVSVIAVGQDREIPYFVMEWLEGATLYEVLRCFDGRRAEELTGMDLWGAVRKLADRAIEQGDGDDSSGIAQPPDLFRGTWCDVSVRITREIAEVLQYAHRQGIVHRDIKPSNIWITPEGRTVLIDFGLARTADSSRLTRTGAQMGSLLYMSPEQVAGARVDERTDIYSLGVTLYETLAFRSPFEADSSEITVQRIVAGDAATPRTWNPAIPREAQTVCLAAMSRDVERRYRNAAALSRDLANLLDRRPIEARPPGWMLRTRRWTERHPARAVGLVLLASLVFFALFTAVRERTALRRIQLLADAHWIEKLTAEARSFWPMDPGKLGDIERWLGEVGEIREQHTVHQRELAVLRRRALPYTAEAEARDRAPTEQKLAGLRSELRLVRALVDRAEDHDVAMAQNGAEIADLENLIRELSESDMRSTWEFSSRSDEWRHERLTRLVEQEYRDLLDLESEVREHRTGVESVRRESLVERDEDWKYAIADIARLEVYAGLQLELQMGLRPLRRDPVSGLWEFLHLLSGAEPQPAPSHADPARLAIDERSGLVMVLLPGGAALIGAREREEDPEIPITEQNHLAEDRPHTVDLAPFFLSKYEMTVGQYRRLGGALATRQAPSSLPILASRKEVLSVLDRIWLTLPTEAQWEYACRAGTETVFYTGDTVASLEGHANIADRSQLGWPVTILRPGQYTERFDDGFELEAPVGSFLPNPFGLYDVHGNAAEWVADVFVTRAYSTMEWRPGDGLRYFARDWIPGLRYGIRGGDFASGPTQVRSARRFGVMAEIRWRQPGVRPARRILP